MNISAREVLEEFLKRRVPHSGQSIQGHWIDLRGPMFRNNVVDTPLHKKGFDADCIRCVFDKLIGEIMKNTSVLQDWVVTIPIRMQSTLILGLRGPDTHVAPGIKTITRWLRGLAFKPGNPDNVKEFMHSMPEAIVKKGPTAKELEFCTQHYYSHLMHALEVVAYKHPNEAASRMALDRYIAMCVAFHLPVETTMEFEDRLGTKKWPGGGQPDTFDEAVDMIDGPKDTTY
jgi:hypothetical protein